jgi:hypothetical protein
MKDLPRRNRKLQMVRRYLFYFIFERHSQSSMDILASTTILIDNDPPGLKQLKEWRHKLQRAFLGESGINPQVSFASNTMTERRPLSTHLLHYHHSLSFSRVLEPDQEVICNRKWQNVLNTSMLWKLSTATENSSS